MGEQEQTANNKNRLIRRERKKRQRSKEGKEERQAMTHLQVLPKNHPKTNPGGDRLNSKTNLNMQYDLRCYVKRLVTRASQFSYIHVIFI